MPEMNRFVVPSALVLALGLAGCSSVEGVLSGDKLDYRSQAAKTAPLEVPPDLTQLSREQQRYQPQNGPVSAATYQQAVPAATATAPAAGTAWVPKTLPGFRLPVMIRSSRRWATCASSAPATSAGW